MRQALSVSTLVAVVTFVGALSAQAPESLIKAAAADPMTFVRLLAEARVPAGLEIRQSDKSRPPRPSAAFQRERLMQEAHVPLDSVVGAFNDAHLNYRATISRGVVVVRPTERRAAFLDRVSAQGDWQARGLMAFAAIVFAPLRSTPGQRSGQVGSIPGPAGVEIDRGEEMDLSINTAGLTVLDVLNEISRRAPGHAWIVVTKGDDMPSITSFGFLHNYGVSTEQPLEK